MKRDGRSSASRINAKPRRRGFVHRPLNVGSIVLTWLAISRMRLRWNRPPRSRLAGLVPYHEPMTIRPLNPVKRDGQVEAFRRPRQLENQIGPGGFGAGLEICRDFRGGIEAGIGAGVEGRLAP